ncbi:CheR family methyltransferase [Desulfovibrio sp. JC010]|uniref:CheR family methyltransferase n=1 Tax=Desulfovibrio sp. JC010 TaxID=2593641 RepID=UPI0013D2AED8|nr:CheR family methyltransferase [Desulfovibrio sp. JC010]NDV26335.1 chemotaxis protein CheR [Desulfovibrio sp. JC010]
MNLDPFHKILNRAMGLAPDSLARSGVKLALKARMRETGCDEKQYLALLRSGDNELSELVEEIVVPETWFFRDSKPFELLFETAAGKKNNEFRVLSAPCSTGEEPYSIAMTLMGAGLKEFRVDGVDISERALLKARSGIYTENSFRTEIPFYAERWFSKCAQGRRLAQDVLDVVRFHAGNILEGCLPHGRYDVIFCRNLLIYLDDGSRKCLAELLNEKLKDDGLLFVGHAEILPIFNDWFTPVRKQGTFALRKGKRKVAALLKPPVCTRHESSGDDVQKPQHAAHRPFKAVSPLKPVVLPRKEHKVPRENEEKRSSGLSVHEIKKLADRGKTVEALDMCERVLRESGPDSELFHLCGLLHESAGNISMAEECYGKALYLEPDHMESLVHLALLLENRGDSRKAEIMRNRARRAEKRNEAG